jgi:hypothetical protein
MERGEVEETAGRLSVGRPFAGCATIGKIAYMGR